MIIDYMPTHANKKSKTQKRTIQRLKKRCDALQDNSNDKDLTHDKLIELLGTACKYCNNLENHLKTKGYGRKDIEGIKESAISIGT